MTSGARPDPAADARADAGLHAAAAEELLEDGDAVAAVARALLSCSARLEELAVVGGRLHAALAAILARLPEP